jgi:hypothetical protein
MTLNYRDKVMPMLGCELIPGNAFQRLFGQIDCGGVVIAGKPVQHRISGLKDP